MKIFANKKAPLEGSKVQRVSKLPDNELLSWFNLNIMEVGAQFDQWRYHDSSLEELSMAMDSLNEIWAEIRARQSGRNNP